jgi:ribosomal protein S6--L-glutamate ligase
MEVNSSPGLEGVETATGVDVAGKIIEFIEKTWRHGKTQTKGSGLVEPAGIEPATS